MSTPLTISVVIATLDRSQLVGATMRALRAQSHQPLQVIIVEQGEASPEVAAVLSETWQDSGVLIPDRRLGASGARAIGLEAARGDVVLCLDDDVIIDDPEFIATHAKCYTDPSVAAVCGRSIEMDTSGHGPSLTPPNILMPFCQIYGSADCQTRTFCTCLKGANMSIRREILEQVGGFDLGLGATYMHEDTDLALRLGGAGHKILFEPSACLVHIAAKRGGGRHHVTTVASPRHLAFRDRVLLFKKHASGWTLPLFVGWNVAMGMRPLLGGRIRASADALQGLAAGFKTYGHLRRWRQS